MGGGESERARVGACLDSRGLFVALLIFCNYLKDLVGCVIETSTGQHSDVRRRRRVIASFEEII